MIRTATILMTMLLATSTICAGPVVFMRPAAANPYQDIIDFDLTTIGFPFHEGDAHFEDSWHIHDYSTNTVDTWAPASGIATVEEGGNYCYAFNGTSGTRIYSGALAATPLNIYGAAADPAFTMAAWVKSTNATATLMPIVCRMVDYDRQYRFAWAQVSGTVGRMQVLMYDGAYAMYTHSSDNIDLSSWHHVAVTYDGSSTTNGIKYYNDGVLALGTAASKHASYVRMETENITTFVGYYDAATGSDASWKGYLDDVRLYYGELTSDQVAALYAAGRYPDP